MIDYEQMDKNRENIARFFNGLIGEGYKEKILKAYPNTVWKFTGNGDLPSLAENQVWCCWCGCGEKNPVLIPELNYSVVSDQSEDEGLRGGLLEGEVSAHWQSPCYRQTDDYDEHYGMFVWDNEADKEVTGISLEGDR